MVKTYATMEGSVFKNDKPKVVEQAVRSHWWAGAKALGKTKAGDVSSHLGVLNQRVKVERSQGGRLTQKKRRRSPTLVNRYGFTEEV